MHHSCKHIARLRSLMLLAVAIVSSQMVHAQLVPNLGGQRAGISAFQFLKIGVGGRGVAMGETFVAVANDASALFWNPAGMAQFSGNQVIFSHTEYVVDIRHEFLGGVYHFSGEDALGFSLSSLHMDDMAVRTETQPFGTGEQFTFGDVAVALSYARKMTDQFSFGITFRYVEETLDRLKMRGMMADLGTYYWTGIGSTRFAVVVSNFGADVTPSGDVRQFGGGSANTFQSFSPPTLFKVGIAMEPYQTEHQRVTTSFELQHPNDNAENIHAGVEYAWNEWLQIRGGLKRTIGEPLFGRDGTGSADYTLGLGIATPVSIATVQFDYAYANFNLLGSLHRVSLGLSF